MYTDNLVNWLMELTQTTSPYFAVYNFLIQTTVFLSVTALLIMLFKLIFKNKLSAKWHVLIWAILLIRFVVPNLPSSEVSIFNTAKIGEQTIMQSSYQNVVTQNYEQTDTNDDDNYTVAEGLQKMVESDNNADYSDYSETSSGFILRIDGVVSLVWAGGAVLLLGYFIIVLSFYHRKLKKNRKGVDDATLEILNQCKEKLKIKRDVKVYFAETTPMLIGLFRPTIYIPDGNSEAETRDTLLHELSHMKNFDILWSMLATLLLCLNWFNPIMWISFFMFKRDIEVFCDERTLRYAEDKQSYARLLLKTATVRKEKFVLGTTSLQSGKADVKRRIKYMAKFRKPAVATVVVAAILISILSACCLTNPLNVSDKNDNSYQIINETLGKPVLSDLDFSPGFSEVPNIIYADNSKAIISGGCGIVVYNFSQREVTQRISYQHLLELGMGLPFGIASADGKQVYIRDGEEDMAGSESVNSDFLTLVLDVEEGTLKDTTSDFPEIFKRYSLSEKKKSAFGIDNWYVGSTYVKVGNNILYVQGTSDWRPKKLSLVKYNKATGEREEYKIFQS